MRQVPWNSQFGEDVYLHDTFFVNKRNGFYLEMGALNGVRGSNTRWFAEAAGWKGLLIEACPGEVRQTCILLMQIRLMSFMRYK